jgi:hypothetical protein
MHGKRPLTLAALALVSLVLVCTAFAGSEVTRQRIAIEGRFDTTSGKSAWRLVPVSGGPLGRDSGKGTGTGNAKMAVVKPNGQSVIPLTGGDSLRSALGTLELTENVGSHDAGNGFSADTGTWKLVGATGAYAGYRGGGGFAAVGTPRGIVNFRTDGYVSKR